MNKSAATKKKTVSRNYTSTTLKILFGQSGNECAEPSCSNPIIASATPVSDAATIAHIAHIYAASEDGPRGKMGLTAKELNHHDNLLLLCPTHHVNVDTQHETYPAIMLLKWKSDHVRKFGDLQKAKATDIGFLELELAAKALMAENEPYVGIEETAPPMPPVQKINKNNLGIGTTKLLKVGIAMSHEVKSMLQNAAQLDASFPDRLKNGFQNKYAALVECGLHSDDLFEALYVWAGGANTDPKRSVAGLCLLSHLFILCDVFESD